jgi:hypothetical protein
VRDDDEHSPAVAVADPGNAAGRRRGHGRPERGDQVDARVEAVAARAEAVADRRCERPREPERRRRERPLQRRNGERAGAAVRRQPGPPLVAPQRPERVPPEDAVDRPRREAVPRELELQLRDVPAGGAAPQHAAAEGVAGEASERATRPRPGDPVDR